MTHLHIQEHDFRGAPSSSSDEDHTGRFQGLDVNVCLFDVKTEEGSPDSRRNPSSGHKDKPVGRDRSWWVE